MVLRAPHWRHKGMQGIISTEHARTRIAMYSLRDRRTPRAAPHPIMSSGNRENPSRALRIAGIQPFQVMEVMERARRLEATGRRVIHLEIGQPDFGAPAAVRTAAATAIAADPLGYTPTLGIPALRHALSDYYAARLQAAVPAGRIAVTAGASGALLLALGALVNPGDEVLMPDPCYACNANFVRLYGGEPVFMPVDAAQDFQPRLADVQANWSPRSRGVMLASPANPTGTLIDRAEFSAIAAWVEAQRGFVIMDEIYQELLYGERPWTAAASHPGTWVVNSFSKFFGMTGWRLGWMVAPPGGIDDVEKLAQNLYICPSAPAQHAALAAFSPATLAELDARRQEFQRRRDYLVPALRKLGLGLDKQPQGAFYAYADCSFTGMDSATLAARLLEEAGVAVTPGADFGRHRADRFVRFAYTRSLAELEEGVERMARMLIR